MSAQALADDTVTISPEARLQLLRDLYVRYMSEAENHLEVANGRMFGEFEFKPGDVEIRLRLAIQSLHELIDQLNGKGS